ncbi:HSP70 family molecular chaperone [Methylobacterium sp. 4-46]|uniref:Hsp70 family protein n=1 Tax=unclassified Methylobacterium TaxID=2615210 RepID=UPI000152C746|nr:MULTISPECIES: Hsp70 family protein [Methylobacterium]ACA17017.1 HSP70 family molecular chaperone [Methylobacterium sp. 4-46]WFT82706.1 Hsp70 family protein [Methylobacterium nodulans]
MPQPVSIGIDFGTTNTVLALAGPEGGVEAVTFRHGAEERRTYLSALAFWQEGRGAAAGTRLAGGPFAVEAFLEGHLGLRFIQSFKSFAASAAFRETRIFRERYQFEDLLTAFLRTLQRDAGAGLDLTGARVVVGRPVRFVGQNPDEALAMRRYAAAFARLGPGETLTAYEPVGAAFFFARRLEGAATVLIADFGGGTSDFSVMRFSREGDGRLTATPLGHSGVGVAGDAFDARIVEHLVAPRLGKGGSYRGMGGKVLPLPSHYYANLSRWHQLALMKWSGDLQDLRDLARAAVDPAPLADFVALIENDLGFPLYQAVSATKVALSARDEAEFRFVGPGTGLDIRATLDRATFESLIAPEVARIAAAVDDALAAAAVPAGAIDRVFLTGGTSLVPAVRALFTERFGAGRVASSDQFESIAHGLALLGQMPDAERWATGRL